MYKNLRNDKPEEKQAERFYVTTQKIIVKGTYTEPLYDEHPYLGTYDSVVTVTIPKNCRVYLSDTAIVDADMDFEGYGVSLYSGSMRINHRLDLLPDDAIKEVSEKEWLKIWKTQSRYNEFYKEFCYHEEVCENIEYHTGACLHDEIQKVVTQEDYERLSEEILKQGENYIQHMYQALNAWRNMKECFI